MLVLMITVMMMIYNIHKGRCNSRFCYFSNIMPGYLIHCTNKACKENGSDTRFIINFNKVCTQYFLLTLIIIDMIQKMTVKKIW